MYDQTTECASVPPSATYSQGDERAEHGRARCHTNGIRSAGERHGPALYAGPWMLLHQEAETGLVVRPWQFATRSPFVWLEAIARTVVSNARTLPPQSDRISAWSARGSKRGGLERAQYAASDLTRSGMSSERSRSRGTTNGSPKRVASGSSPGGNCGRDEAAAGFVPCGCVEHRAEPSEHRVVERLEMQDRDREGGKVGV
jgi:hypothetical protein